MKLYVKVVYPISNYAKCIRHINKVIKFMMTMKMTMTMMMMMIMQKEHLNVKSVENSLIGVE